MSPVPECQYKIIEGWCPGVLFTSTMYYKDELKIADCHNVVSIRHPLIFTFSIQTVKNEFDFDIFSGVSVNQVIPPTGDNIFVSFLMFLTGEANSMVSMPIVFVEQAIAMK